jgi:hypothetical protein
MMGAHGVTPNSGFGGMQDHYGKKPRNSLIRINRQGIDLPQKLLFAGHGGGLF